MTCVKICSIKFMIIVVQYSNTILVSHINMNESLIHTQFDSGLVFKFYVLIN